MLLIKAKERQQCQDYESLSHGACERLSHTPPKRLLQRLETECATLTQSTSSFAFSSLSTSPPIPHTLQSWHPGKRTQKRPPETQRYGHILPSYRSFRGC